MSAEILIVDDEADIRDLVAGILQDEGYVTRTARNSDEALAAIVARRPNLVFLDIWLQGSKLDGLQLLNAFKQEHPEMPVVMISGHGNIETAVAAIKHGAYDFIEKPFKADRLAELVNRRRTSHHADRHGRERLKLLDLASQARGFESTVGDQNQPVRLERLLDEVVGATLDCRHRGFDIAVAGDHHHRHFRMLLLDGIEQLETVEPAALQPYVEK